MDGREWHSEDLARARQPTLSALMSLGRVVPSGQTVGARRGSIRGVESVSEKRACSQVTFGWTILSSSSPTPRRA